MDKIAQIKTRLRYRYALLMAVGIIVSLLWVYYQNESKLSYNGKSIDYWFDHLPMSVASFDGTNYLAYSATTISANGQIWGSSDEKLAATALEAFESFGTNAIPYLLAKLRHHDLLPERLIQRTCYEVGIDCRILPFRPAYTVVAQATDALIRMGELPENVLTELSDLKVCKTRPTRDSAGYILQVMERLKRQRRNSN